ncbi:unnamed protein product, partial [Litomosoides sigmodontis]
MVSRSLFTGKVAAFFAQRTESLDEDVVNCTLGENYPPYIKQLPNLCIFGIKFTDGFNKELFDNDPSKDGVIASQLDTVGSDLCKLTQTNAKDLFQEIVILVDGHFSDLFVTCCKKCDYDSVIDVRIKLKSQFLRHRYAIIEQLEEGIGYEMMKRSVEYDTPMKCITEDYREQPVTGNNAVCYTYGEEEFVNMYAGEGYPLKLKNLLKMGQYNAAVANQKLGHHCKMHYARRST